MVELCRIVDRSNHIPVDQWDTEANPIPESSRIFKNIRGEIILPIAEFYFGCDPAKQSLDYFAMNAKRSYNSDETREHICRYLNYFEEFYDTDRILIAVIAQIKTLIDYEPLYKISNFMDDVNKYIIRNPDITYNVTHFVADNYIIQLSNNNNKTPNLQYNNEHAKILYEISLLMNMYIPLAAHYMYIHNIKTSEDVKSFMLRLFDLCVVKYEQERNIFIYDKIYETAGSVVNKSKNPDKPLWEKNKIRGTNTTTHTKDSVVDIILQIMPKYFYEKNIINFNYFSNRQCLRYNITDIAYEYQFSKLSSSKRDADQNSEYDRYEAGTIKKDEGLALQNKVTAEQAIRKIEQQYGPFDDDEIEHYYRALTKNGAQVINSFQHTLINYLYFSEFGDPITATAIHGNKDYIKMMIAAKRMLKNRGMVLLPYILSSRMTRMAARRVISKKDMTRIENDMRYQQIKNKYGNTDIDSYIIGIIGTVVSSSFEIIDWDENLHKPTAYDGVAVPMINDNLISEILDFVLMI